MAEKKSQDNGKEQMHVMTDAQGRVRTITVADWKKNEAVYLAEGFTRPSSIPQE